MAVFTYDAEEANLIHDFANNFFDNSEAAETSILQLESAPGDPELINALFRAVHSIKGNCGILGVDPLADLLQELESILELVRTGEIVFQTLIGDITLLIFDRCNAFVVSLDRHLEARYDADLFKAISQQMGQAVSVAPEQRSAVLIKALSLLDPDTSQLLQAPNKDELLNRFQIEASADLLFVMQLAEQTQSRAAFWQGRIERILSWLIALNEYAGQPVPPEQLLVAVCLHDIGMAMLPSTVILKESPLTADEKQSIQNHVWVASRLASSFPDWHMAKMIIDQHQENFDGSGYPFGLRGDEICTGAQLLAVVHAFEAITHGYSKTLSRKRPLMRAVMELNRFSGTQFNPKWVDTFMEVTRVT
ncbi:HD domain-containing phosphohydrolase [Reinekea sp.]|jgi:HD-GYP domain-containing protein (c-di-GMP phosphodiesterase class II)|uniref:HD domain-containing phosphohydrolase n=1 Tax=Reinekea sp. TaxID=1970455 RepID=UPI002A7ED6E8|nr:HD domain-containing phosphohydrolase [Reinekea sp.]